MRGTHLILACGAVLAAAACNRGTMTTMDGGTDAGPLPDLGVDLGDAFVLPDATVDPCNPAGGMVPIGGSCSSTAQCDDGCYCNGSELCTGGTCVVGGDPCGTLTTQPCATTACLEETNRCFVQPHDDRCSNGDACDGRETCDPVNGCIMGSPPECNDENPCTVDGCDHGTGCTYMARDLDGDGYTDGHCGGDDCNDLPPDGASIHPGAMEVCDNGRDDNCDGLRDYNDPTCIPTNDTCATARMLPGRGTYSASSTSLHGDYSLSCGGATSQADAVFTFHIDAVQDVRASFAGDGGGEIAIRDMSACATGPDLHCAAGSSAPSTFARGLPAGDYAIIVKTNSTGPFDLTLTINSPTGVPAGDDCAHTIVVTPDGPTASVSMAGLVQDYAPSCGTVDSTYHDAVFQFTLATTRDVTITTTTPGTSSFMNEFAVYSTDPCGPTTSELRCHVLPAFSGTTDSELFRSLTAGTYYVTVASDGSGMASVHVATAAPTPVPANDRCSGAISLAPPSGRRATDTLIGFADDAASGSCTFGATGYPDSFYSFALSSGMTTFDAIVRTPTGVTTPLYLSILNRCGGTEVTGMCVASSSGGGGTYQTASIELAGGTPGTYILQVEEQVTTWGGVPSDYSITWLYSP